MNQKQQPCNCLEKMEQKILSFCKENGDLINPSEAKFDNTGIILDNSNNSPSIQHYLPVTILSETKTGKVKKTKLNITLSYCPTCGQSWKGKEERS